MCKMPWAKTRATMTQQEITKMRSLQVSTNDIKERTLQWEAYDCITNENKDAKKIVQVGKGHTD